MRSPRKVVTPNWMPGNFFNMSSISFSIFSCSSPEIGLRSTWNSLRLRAPGVLAQFGAAHLLFDRVDVGVVQQFPRNLRANPQRFRQGGAGRGEDLEDEMAFAEVGQQFAADERQPRDRSNAHHGHHGDDGARPAGNETQHAAVAGLQPVLETRFVGLLHAPVEEQKRQRGRERQRDQQRGHDGQDVAQRQRRKKAALQPGERQHRQEDQRDDERGIDDRAPHFERGAQHHVERPDAAAPGSCSHAAGGKCSPRQ